MAAMVMVVVLGVGEGQEVAEALHLGALHATRFGEAETIGWARAHQLTRLGRCRLTFLGA